MLYNIWLMNLKCKPWSDSGISTFPMSSGMSDLLMLGSVLCLCRDKVFLTLMCSREGIGPSDRTFVPAIQHSLLLPRGFLGAPFCLAAEDQVPLAGSPDLLFPVERLPSHLALGWYRASLISSSSLSKVRSCTPQRAANWMWETALQGLAKMILRGPRPSPALVPALPGMGKKPELGLPPAPTFPDSLGTGP